MHEQTAEGHVSLIKYFKSGLTRHEETDKPVWNKWIEYLKRKIVFGKKVFEFSRAK